MHPAPVSAREGAVPVEYLGQVCHGEGIHRVGTVCSGQGGGRARSLRKGPECRLAFPHAAGSPREVPQMLAASGLALGSGRSEVTSESPCLWVGFFSGADLWGTYGADSAVHGGSRSPLETQPKNSLAGP